MITEGDTAPDFRLVGIDSNEAGLYRLSDEIEERPVLLSFQSVPARSIHDRVMEPLQWFQLIDDLAVFVVSNGNYNTHRESVEEGDVPVPLLIDTDESVAEQYGIRYDAHETSNANVAVYLVDRSRTIQYAVTVNDLPPEKSIEYGDVWRVVRQYYPTTWEHQGLGIVEYV